ncbi:unnamed protein product [Closterium sp. Naga37s-1]|nr:unnamed protein product [Closterium sp. Naga37s-1]
MGRLKLATQRTSALNATPAGEVEKRRKLSYELLGEAGENLFITSPFLCDYGCHITVGRLPFLSHLPSFPSRSVFSIPPSYPCALPLIPIHARPPPPAGRNVYMNFGCVLLDCNRITIGDDVLFGPYVQLYTAAHPTHPATRLTGVETAHAITIGSNVWLGGGVIVCPGVSIGSHTTIGAGSVVTKDIPDCCVAVGNPCRVIKTVPAPEPRAELLPPANGEGGTDMEKE